MGRVDIPDPAAALEAGWAESAQRLGEWAFWPERCEVRYAGKPVLSIPPGNTSAVLLYLFQRWPHAARVHDMEVELCIALGSSQAYVARIRGELGREFVLSPRRGLLVLNPEAVPCG